MPPILVAKNDVLAAAFRVRRLGNHAGLVWLERTQPELTELLLDTASDLHRRLSRARLPPVVVRRLVRRVENLGVTLTDAVLTAHLRDCRQSRGLVIPPLT